MDAEMPVCHKCSERAAYWGSRAVMAVIVAKDADVAAGYATDAAYWGRRAERCRQACPAYTCPPAR